MTAAEALRTVIAQAAPVLRRAAASLWLEPGLERRYVEYLYAMHGVVRASVPLMAVAASRCDDLAPTDPTAGPLAAYLRHHIVEEKGHDEWLLADLRALAVDPSPAVARPPSGPVARLVGPQYYWACHHHPVALLGYIAVLESHAPDPGLAEWIVARAGVPESAVRTVRAHAALDSGHAEALYQVVSSLPLTAEQRQALTRSALYTVDALTSVLDDVVRRARRDNSTPIGGRHD
jgi:hypothetical protein